MERPASGWISRLLNRRNRAERGVKNFVLRLSCSRNTAKSVMLSILTLVLSFLAAGCTSFSPPEEFPPDVDVEPVVSERFHGLAVFGHEVRSFRPCGSEDVLWTTDQTGILWDLHQELAPKRQPYEELFFVLEGRRGPPPEEGFGSDYSGELVVRKVLYAAQEGFSCESEWTKFRWRTYGNEPFWSAEVSDRGLALKRLGEPDLSWVDLREKQAEQGMVYVSEDAVENQVALEIISAPCRDSMSGAFFGYAAKLRLGSEELYGCALQGELTTDD